VEHANNVWLPKAIVHARSQAKRMGLDPEIQAGPGHTVEEGAGFYLAMDGQVDVLLDVIARSGHSTPCEVL
jgi:hypothetical protein